MRDVGEPAVVTEVSQPGGELAVIAPTPASIADFFIPWSLTETGSAQRSNRAFSRALRRRLVVSPASPNQPLTDMLSEQQAGRYRRLSFWRGLQTYGGGLLTLASFPITGGAGLAWLTSAAAVSAGAGTVTAVSLTSGLLLGVNASRASRASRGDDLELRRLGAERFAKWVGERYGLKVEAAALVDSLGEVFIEGDLCCGENTSEPCRKHSTFRTTNGEKYMLAGEAGQLHVERFVPKPKKRKRAKAAKKAARELDLKPLMADDRFSSEAAVLISQIGELLVKVHRAPLSAEQEHVVKRAQQDVLGLAQLNAQLHELAAPTGEDERNFAATLLTLRDELREVLDQQHAALSKEVRIAAAYVSERQRSSRLSLKKDS